MDPIREKNYPCLAFRLGTVEYEAALRLQNRLAEARLREETEDVLLVLQHPPVITLGKSGKAHNVLAPEKLAEKKIKVVYTDRGGDVTYHGPGQLVVYPILNLNLHGLSIPDYVWNLEEVTVRLLARFGIAAGRLEKLRGVWVGQEKICSLGVHLSRGISKHGLALNVNTNLDPFMLINPCGTGRPMTSMAKILQREFPMAAIEAAILEDFAGVFGFALREENAASLESYR